MSALRRRGISSFNLAFLDIMFCGFGAVVLLVLIINSNALQRREEIFDDLRGEVDLLQQEVESGDKNLVEIKNSLEETDKELTITRGEARQVLAALEQTRLELADARGTTRARKAHIKALVSDLKSLDDQEKAFGAQAAAAMERGRNVHRFSGDGQRQYLTGLKLGGKRVLILLDRSASMLDSSIVNVIRRRNMKDAEKRTAPKWRQARRTVAWLVANMSPSSSLQVYGFNTSAQSVLQDSAGQWISASDNIAVNKLVAAANQLVPEQGTSLENAFTAAAAMSPPPDNILLITDGLPTQGRNKPRSSSVSGEGRVKLFQRALRGLPRSIPVNTILFPMEGDPMAAVLFWKLAIDSHGSFLTPTSDWP
jgi:hypothetical protein